MRVDDHGQFFRFGYIALAAISGAFTALGFVKWQEMSRAEMWLTIAGGFSFAIFVTPWVAHELLGVAETNHRAIAALTYVFGSGSNILLPTIIRSIRRLLGSEEKEA
jgi:hypothetical protein